MDRNRHSTSVNALPAITSVVNAPGYFTKGDPAHGISATVPTQDWANGITEEIVGAIEESNQALNINDNKQLTRAISSISKRKNWLINGDFDIWSYGTVATNPVGYSTADRWITACSGTTMTVSKQDFFFWATDGISHPKNYIQAVVNNGNGPTDTAWIAQIIEDVANLSGRVVTLSFWAKADSSKALGVEVGQFFGSGGAPSSSVRHCVGQQIQLTTDWTKYSITGTLPSVQGKNIGTNQDDGVGVVFYFDSGSDTAMAFASSNLGHQSGVFQIARVQLEDGNMASDFDERPIAVEQAMCQRYHCRIQPAGTITGSVAGSGYKQSHLVKWPTTMKFTPTISISTSGASMTNISGATVINPTVDGCNLVTTATTSAGDSSFVFNSGCYIDAAAELHLS
jgi:hypothetical protein